MALWLLPACNSDASDATEDAVTVPSARRPVHCIPCARLAEQTGEDAFCLEGPARLLHATLTMCDDGVHAGIDAESPVRLAVGEEAFALVRATCGDNIRADRIFAVKGLWGRGCFRPWSRGSVLSVEVVPELCDLEYSYFDMLLVASPRDRRQDEFYLTTRNLLRGSCKPHKPLPEDFGPHGWGQTPSRGWGQPPSSGGGDP